MYPCDYDVALFAAFTVGNNGGVSGVDFIEVYCSDALRVDVVFVFQVFVIVNYAECAVRFKYLTFDDCRLDPVAFFVGATVAICADLYPANAVLIDRKFICV